MDGGLNKNFKRVVLYLSLISTWRKKNKKKERKKKIRKRKDKIRWIVRIFDVVRAV